MDLVGFSQNASAATRSTDESTSRSKTVQVVPHLINEIIAMIIKVAQTPIGNGQENGAEPELPAIVMMELGGTVGDIESAPFFEAFRQFRLRPEGQKLFHIHVRLVPMKIRITRDQCASLAL
eukprot:SAG31_NODE_15867_length_734_cov_1.121260_2_plen_122_part_00